MELIVGGYGVLAIAEASRKTNYDQPTTIPQPTQSQLLRQWRGRHSLLHYAYATTGYAPFKPCKYNTCSKKVLQTKIAK